MACLCPILIGFVVPCAIAGPSKGPFTPTKPGYAEVEVEPLYRADHQGVEALPTYHSRRRAFLIPFQAPAGTFRLDLYVSEDNGKTYRRAALARATDQRFRFQARQDGTYVFAVLAVDSEGRTNPRALKEARPQLKVCVDTRPPFGVIRVTPPAGERSGGGPPNPP
jgi:hypothetical protein